MRCANVAASPHPPARMGSSAARFGFVAATSAPFMPHNGSKHAAVAHAQTTAAYFIACFSIFRSIYMLAACSRCYLLLQHKNVATNLRRITLHVCGNSNKLLPQMRKTHTRAHRYNSWCSHAATTTYLFYLLNKLHTLHWLLPLLGQLPAPVALLGGACTPLLCSALELFIAVVVAAAAGRSLFSLLMLACFAMMTHGAPHIWYNAAVSCRCTCLPLLLLSQIVGNAIFTFIAYWRLSKREWWQISICENRQFICYFVFYSPILRAV